MLRVSTAAAVAGEGGPEERPVASRCAWEGVPGPGAALLLLHTNSAIVRNAPTPDGRHFIGPLRWQRETPMQWGEVGLRCSLAASSPQYSLKLPSPTHRAPTETPARRLLPALHLCAAETFARLPIPPHNLTHQSSSASAATMSHLNALLAQFKKGQKNANVVQADLRQEREARLAKAEQTGGPPAGGGGSGGGSAAPPDRLPANRICLLPSLLQPRPRPSRGRARQRLPPPAMPRHP